MAGSGLQWNDVFILCDDDSSPTVSLVLELQRQGVPVGALSRNPTQQDIEQVAVGRANQVTVAWWGSVQGLERRVVVGLGGGRGRLACMSRCTGQLIWIDKAYG